PIHHHDLHSCPTRRSSDLKRKGRIRSRRSYAALAFYPVWRSAHAEQHAQRFDQSSGGGRDRLVEVLGDRGQLGRGGRTAEDGDQDRKSTRLNSSHVKISYA